MPPSQPQASTLPWTPRDGEAKPPELWGDFSAVLSCKGDAERGAGLPCWSWGFGGIWMTINAPAMKRPGLSGDAVSNHFQLPGCTAI